MPLGPVTSGGLPMRQTAEGAVHNTVVVTLAHASNSAQLLVLAESSRRVGFSCIVVEPIGTASEALLTLQGRGQAVVPNGSQALATGGECPRLRPHKLRYLP